MRRAQRCCGSESSWRASSRRTYLSTAPLSACVNAAVGLAERTSCSTCCTRGCCCGGGAAGPVNTTVPTTPETRAQTHKADALHAHGGGAEGRREGGRGPTVAALLQQLGEGQSESKQGQSSLPRQPRTHGENAQHPDIFSSHEQANSTFPPRAAPPAAPPQPLP